VADIAKGADVAESGTWKLVFSLAKEDQDFQPEAVMADNQVICSAASLALPVQKIAIQAIVILRAIGRFLFGDEKPDRCRAFGTKYAGVKRRIGDTELSA
jgi:hypothetical protein